MVLLELLLDRSHLQVVGGQNPGLSHIAGAQTVATVLPNSVFVQYMFIAPITACFNIVIHYEGVDADTVAWLSNVSDAVSIASLLGVIYANQVLIVRFLRLL